MASVRMRSWRPLELAGHVRAGRRAVPAGPCAMVSVVVMPCRRVGTGRTTVSCCTLRA
jgi:hypothetical protein